ncbi:NAD-dependent epimerase/dehydratase family protein [Actinacidiphila acididurans]|uniref:NAD-dependent epimerase/dehydratase family protein n=1 Tax=Actinacidiphila acididurans TaxID=2784346 RepID=A0ABS2TJ78_9ACTN|nr:NAD-dependent epimerase/dehydratase family protein [Actinacidiphila acididurans]MBM9503406.1 NAD-dependent epimerase/dehydratase family protein [Actinacidiphila acididurans]
MRVFLTGGSGYLGRATLRALVRDGIEVAALARGDSSARTLRDLGATPVQGGLTDLAVLRDAAARADGAIHLASHAGPDTAAIDLAAAQAMQDGLGDRGTYVHTGGVWVYGNTDGVVDETSPQRPPRLTAWRLENEKRVLAAAADGGRPVLVMPGLVYGHGGGLADAFLTEPARTTGAVPVIGDGANHWALVHVDDIAELYVRALRAAPGSVYAGVSDQNLPLVDIARALAESIGLPGSVEPIDYAEAERRMGPIAEAFALDQQLTGAKARRELGWTPTRLDALAELATGK